MNIVTLLRMAAGLAAVQGTAHSALFLTAKPRHGAAEVGVIETMKSNRFFADGTRSYWDFYFGYGLLAAAACFVQAILFWQLGTIAASRPELIRPMVGLFFLANVGHALLVARYFSLYVTIAFDLLIAACLALAFVLAGG
jgi:hypothetical protein